LKTAFIVDSDGNVLVKINGLVDVDWKFFRIKEMKKAG
jgi:hypothetical protein